MFCPKCGTTIKLETVNELIACSCTFVRPKAWWDALQIDINTAIDWKEKEQEIEEIPDELDGYCESPWAD
jgi:hypothetical protein